jgi:nitrate reductase molybdenum cofactor assembly chaperone NarJ/NarW
MKLLTRSRETTLQHRLVWQSSSLLLAYPDERHGERLDSVDRLREHLDPPYAGLIAETVAALRGTDPLRAATEYVDTFDLRRRCTMFLTYWTAGDTRNRGAQMHAFAAAYRDAGVEPPKDEAPDCLPVVLEFAATVDPQAGQRLLADHRLPIDVLRQALTDIGSPYAHVVTAVCQTLPPVAEPDARRLMASGPPAEAVGLQPFTLTVPPRRTEGGR